jgi:hypothetical protein
MFISIARRKNPTLNPKISVNQAVLDHYREAPFIRGTKIKNSFCSFTSLDKLGLNPQSVYGTPIGIYAYPTKYVLGEARLTKKMTALPFAGDAPFVNIFSVKGHIVDLVSVTKKQADDYVEDLIFAYRDYEEQIRNWYEEAATHADIKTDAGYFWHVTYKLKEHISQDTTKSASVVWNKIFRAIDIQGVVDFGDSIIHAAEPTQAVFFETKYIFNLRRFDNKHSNESVEMSKETGTFTIDKKNEFSKRPTKEIVKLLDQDPTLLRFIKNPTKEMQIECLKKDGTVIQYIRNPSEELQKVAVENNPEALFLIANPTDYVKIAVIESKPGFFSRINKSSNLVKLKAVEVGGYNIQHIQNPTKEMQMAAVRSEPSVIGLIINPSEEVQIEAVKSDFSVIQEIKNPSEAVQMAVIEQNAHGLSFIKNPTEAVQLAAVLEDPTILSDEYIKFAESVQIAVISKDGFLIREISNPSEAVQIAAIKENKRALRYISDPTDRVKQLAQSL